MKKIIVNKEMSFGKKVVVYAAYTIVPTLVQLGSQKVAEKFADSTITYGDESEEEMEKKQRTNMIAAVISTTALSFVSMFTVITIMNKIFKKIGFVVEK